MKAKTAKRRSNVAALDRAADEYGADIHYEKTDTDGTHGSEYIEIYAIAPRGFLFNHADAQGDSNPHLLYTRHFTGITSWGTALQIAALKIEQGTRICECEVCTQDRRTAGIMRR